jgi:hypothetical protein
MPDAIGRGGIVEDDIGHRPTFALAARGPLSSQHPPLMTAQASPNPDPLAIGQGVMETVGPDRATPADLPERDDRLASGREEIKLGTLPTSRIRHPWLRPMVEHHHPHHRQVCSPA